MARRLMGAPRSPYATQVSTVLPEDEAASQVFDEFMLANTFQGIMSSFQQICDLLHMHPQPHQVFYQQLKTRLTSWKAQSLWTKLDKRAFSKEYQKGKACSNTRVLIIGGGPCGLRAGIEVALLGGQVVVVEKRDRFSRNNVLHLWPYLIHDLKTLGAKKLFGKFCAGSIDHISIRTMQCIMLKVALLVGVEVHPGVAFEDLVDPSPEGAEHKIGWRAKVSPADHPVSLFEFDVLIGADGKRNTLAGFTRKEFRGKLAIAITANFINRNTQMEASVEEISGVACIFNQRFFKELNEKTGIDLENIVYYKDETHYFVMTAKKHSLLNKGVMLQDHEDPERLLSRENVNQEALMSYACEAADVSTNHQLPKLDFAHNHYGQPDVAMFDFTSMFAAEHSSRVMERNGHRLLIALAGDSLLEPFWPTGSGCARGFFGAMDAAWMIRSWASGTLTPLEVLAERESIYQLLSQTTPESVNKKFTMYTIDPNTRYKNLDSNFFKPHQMKRYYEGGTPESLAQMVKLSEERTLQYECYRDSHNLLRWLQKELECYRSQVQILDLTLSWRSGIALAGLIHKYRPELINFFQMDASKIAENNEMIFELAQREFGIKPLVTVADMENPDGPDKTLMASYLTSFYEYFRKESIRPPKMARKSDDSEEKVPRKIPGNRSPRQQPSVGKIASRFRQRKDYSSDSDSSEEEEAKRPSKPIYAYGVASQRIRDLKNPEVQPSNGEKKQYDAQEYDKMKLQQELKAMGAEPRGQNKVSALAKDLATKFKESEPVAVKTDPKVPMQVKPQPADLCFFCKDKVYLVERYSVEGVFFHRNCFRCYYCGETIRIGAHVFIKADGLEGRFYCQQHASITSRPKRLKRRSRHFPESLSARTPSNKDSIDSAKTKKTPERMEYMTESEMEESEWEQTSHNLSASLVDLGDRNAGGDGSESSGSSDEDLDWSDGDLSDPDVSWAELARSYSRQLQKKELTKSRSRQGEESGEADDESETETEIEEESEEEEEEEEWESDTETEHESDDMDIGAQGVKKSKDMKPSALQLTKPVELPPEDTKPSPTTAALSRNRLAFFQAVSEPVRINARSFLGLDPPKAVKMEVEEAPVEEEVVVEEEEEEEEGEEPEEVKKRKMSEVEEESKRRRCAEEEFSSSSLPTIEVEEASSASPISDEFDDDYADKMAEDKQASSSEEIIKETPPKAEAEEVEEEEELAGDVTLTDEKIQEDLNDTDGQKDEAPVAAVLPDVVPVESPAPVLLAAESAPGVSALSEDVHYADDHATSALPDVEVKTEVTSPPSPPSGLGIGRELLEEVVREVVYEAISEYRYTIEVTTDESCSSTEVESEDLDDSDGCGMTWKERAKADILRIRMELESKMPTKGNARGQSEADKTSLSLPNVDSDTSDASECLTLNQHEIPSDRTSSVDDLSVFSGPQTPLVGQAPEFPDPDTTLTDRPSKESPEPIKKLAPLAQLSPMIPDGIEVSDEEVTPEEMLEESPLSECEQDVIQIDGACTSETYVDDELTVLATELQRSNTGAGTSILGRYLSRASSSSTKESSESLPWQVESAVEVDVSDAPCSCDATSVTECEPRVDLLSSISSESVNADTRVLDEMDRVKGPFGDALEDVATLDDIKNTDQDGASSAASISYSKQEEPAPEIQPVEASLPEQDAVTAVLPEQEEVPIVLCEQEAEPAVLPEQEGVPIILPEQEEVPIALPEQEAEPAVLPEQEEVPIILPEQEEVPIILPEQEELPTDLSEPLNTPEQEQVPAILTENDEIQHPEQQDVPLPEQVPAVLQESIVPSSSISLASCQLSDTLSSTCSDNLTMLAEKNMCNMTNEEEISTIVLRNQESEREENQPKEEDITPQSLVDEQEESSQNVTAFCSEENLTALAQNNMPDSCTNSQDLSTLVAENQPPAGIPFTPMAPPSASVASHSTPLLHESAASLVSHGASPIYYSDEVELHPQDSQDTLENVGSNDDVNLTDLAKGKEDVCEESMMDLVKKNEAGSDDVLRRIDDMLQNADAQLPPQPSVAEKPSEEKMVFVDTDILSDLLAAAAKPKVVGNDEKDDSIVEFTVCNQSFSVDEKFVTARKKVHKEEEDNEEESLSSSSPSSRSSVLVLDSTSAALTTTDSADPLDDSHSVDLLLTTNTEDSSSIENILEANMSHDESEDVDLSELEKESEMNAANHHMNNGFNDSPALSITDASLNSTLMHSAQSSVADSSYYTPNTSNTDNKKDDSSLLSVNRSQADDSVSESSDQRSISSWRTASPVYSPNKLTDAKRRFFFEAAQPVRIDHKKVFKEIDRKKAVIAKEVSEQEFTRETNSKVLDLKTPEWKSVDSAAAAPTTPTAGVPRSNSANGDSDALYKPSTSKKVEATKADKRRMLPNIPSKTNVDLTKKVLTPEEIKMIKEVEKSKGRSSGREKVLSDGEQNSTRKGLLRKRDNRPLSEKTKKKSEGGFRPFSSKSHQQNSSQSDSSTLSSTESPNLPTKEKVDKRGKVQMRKEDKENAKSPPVGEKKRRSLLSMLMPSKSQEKKAPKSPPPVETRAKSPPIFGRSQAKSKSTPTATDSKKATQAKKLGVKLRPKSGRQLSEEEKRKSMIDEVAPMLQDESKCKGRESMKERIKAVAPPHIIQKTEIAPHAELDEFENESEFGEDKISLRSFKLEQQGLSEEEVARLLKKQQRAAQRRQREQEMKRLRMAQEIQRQLQEVEQRQREVETKGVSIERGLRGEEAPEAPSDETRLMQDWFNVVHEKNVLVRYESELMVHAKELELEDRHSRLEQRLRECMQCPEKRHEESEILKELLEVVEQRDALVALLEEDRLRKSQGSAAAETKKPIKA